MSIITTKIRVNLHSAELIEKAKNIITAYIQRVTGSSARTIEWVDGIITVTYDSIRQLGLEMFGIVKDKLGFKNRDHVTYILG